MNVYDIGRLPVVSREDNQRFLGMIRRADILRAYDIGLTRKSIEQHHQKRFALRSVETNDFLEIEVQPNAPMVGKTLADFPFSDDCLLISIMRHGQGLIAHGDTRIQEGDILTAYVRPDSQANILQQFESTPV
jgi:CIC family chloride channel protein